MKALIVKEVEEFRKMVSFFDFFLSFFLSHYLVFFFESSLIFFRFFLEMQVRPAPTRPPALKRQDTLPVPTREEVLNSQPTIDGHSNTQNNGTTGAEDGYQMMDSPLKEELPSHELERELMYGRMEH